MLSQQLDPFSDSDPNGKSHPKITINVGICNYHHRRHFGSMLIQSCFSQLSLPTGVLINVFFIMWTPAHQELPILCIYRKLSDGNYILFSVTPVFEGELFLTLSNRHETSSTFRLFLIFCLEGVPYACWFFVYGFYFTLSTRSHHFQNHLFCDLGGILD